MDTTIAIYLDGNKVSRISAAHALAEIDGRSVIVYELEDGDQVVHQIDVYARRTAFGEIRGAQVNWAGIGSVGEAGARRYAEMILLAAELIRLSDEIAAEQ